MRLAQSEMPSMAQSRPATQARRGWLGPALAGQRAQRPGHLSRPFGQPGKDALAGAGGDRDTGAEVDHPFSRNLDTGPEDRRAWNRFQAVRTWILWFCAVTKRHIVLTQDYRTTGSSGTPRIEMRRFSPGRCDGTRNPCRAGRG